MNKSELYWLAGLLEGEGCFCYYDSPGIQLVMTDADVVQRAAELMNRHVRGPYEHGEGRKPTFHMEVWGATAIEWMRKLAPIMGKRRREKIREIFKRWITAPGKDHKLGTGITPHCGHPDRPHYALGACRSCYRKKKYEKGLPR